MYATIGLGKEKYHTTLKEKATDPEWYEECDLILPEKYEDSHIEIVVLHRNGLGIDEFLGRIELPLRNYSIHDPPKSEWHALLPKPGHTKNYKRGELEVRLCYIVGKVKDQDSISTASSASKRLKIGKKMLSALGDKLHVKKKEKTKDHIPDLTGLDEGVLEDEDIAENYSISIKVPSKRSDTHSHHDASPPSTAQPSTFTKFTPFPKEKSDARRSPSSSIVSEEDLAQKHGDAGSENSFEMGYGKAGRGPTRSSGGKPRKVSLGKRGLISKDKSQSVWEISNSKSEFGLASGLKSTVGTSKEEGDNSGNKRLPNSTSKDREDFSEPQRKGEDSDLTNRVKPSIPTTATSVSAVGLATVDPSKGSAIGHEALTPQGTAKTGTLKMELKQTPVLVDDDDDDLDDVSPSSARLSGGASITRIPGIALKKPAGDVDLAKPAGDMTRTGSGDSATLAASSVSKKVTVDVGASALAVEVDRATTASFASKENGVRSPTRAAAVAASAADVQSGNPFLSSSHEVRQKQPSDLVQSGKEAGLPGKQHGINPFEDSVVAKPEPRSVPANPFEDEEADDDAAADARAIIRAPLPPRMEMPRKPDADVTAVVQQQPEIKVKATVPPINPFEESIDDVSSKRPAVSQPQPQHALALDPPTVETVTLPVVGDSMLKTLVIEPSSKDAKVSRKVLTSALQRGPLREPAARQEVAAASAPAVAAPTVAAAPAPAVAAVPSAVATASATTALRSALTAVLPPADEPPPTVAASQSSLKVGSGAVRATSSTSMSATTGAENPLKKASSNPFEEDGDDADDHDTSGHMTSQPALRNSHHDVVVQPATSAHNVVGSAGVAPFVSSLSKSKKSQAPAVPTSTDTVARTIQSPADSTTVAASAVLSSAAIPATLAATSSTAAVSTTSTTLSFAAMPATDTKVATPSLTTVVQASLVNTAIPQKQQASASVTETPLSDLESRHYDRSSTSLTSTNGSLDTKSRIRSSTGDASTDQSERPAAGSKRSATMNMVEAVPAEVKQPVSPTASAANIPPVSSSSDGLSRPGKGSSSKGSMLDTVLVGHSLISAITFKAENSSTLTTPLPMVDSACQTFDNQDNIPQEYKGLTKEVLVEMVLRMKSQLAAKEGQVRDLEEYIDQLLLRVMDGNPALLLHPNLSASNRSGKR